VFRAEVLAVKDEDHEQGEHSDREQPAADERDPAPQAGGHAQQDDHGDEAEPGLVNATANPKPATSGISVPIALPPLGRRQPFAVYDTIFSAWTRRAQLDFTRTG
jgi:hypothetical protein